MGSLLDGLLPYAMGLIGLMGAAIAVLFGSRQKAKEDAARAEAKAVATQEALQRNKKTQAALNTSQQDSAAEVADTQQGLREKRRDQFESTD
jgi:hypothetical protein